MSQTQSSNVCFRLEGRFPSPAVWLKILCHHESRQLAARGAKPILPDEGLGLFEQLLQIIVTLARSGLMVMVSTSREGLVDTVHTYELSVKLSGGGLTLWLQIRHQSGNVEMVNIFVIGDPDDVEYFMRQYASHPHDPPNPDGAWTWVQVDDWQEEKEEQPAP